eukprot:CAMPEP_0181293684 /NCGR_PEP_ID=MMETSP1101-20121128/3194_1 /TAXON_ID=46948 /ORGANISM="Rhodomonas abbreviata, Strain Caron Lab Isolate" /LENGTH=908 /DNA_ID=CAMNT_0023398283 /DNA_START=100 /DNA_END=2826 /DNA_ORIENTATION=+
MHEAAHHKSEADCVKRKKKIEAFLAVLIHVVPIGLVQFADYVTDILVVLSFFDSGNTVYGWIGLSFVLASVIFAWVGALFFFGERVEFMRKGEYVTTMIVLLAPLNLHTLYLGWLCSLFMARQEDIKSNSSDSQLAALHNLEAATRAVLDARRRGDRAAAAAAKSRRNDAAKVIPELDKETKNSALTFVVFSASKGVESAFESLPLSVLTLAQIMSGSHTETDLKVLWSSLALSVLSMSFGFSSAAVQMRREGPYSTSQTDMTNGRDCLLFLATVANVMWSSFAMSLCLAREGLAPANYLLPLATMLLLWPFYVVKAAHDCAKGGLQAIAALIFSIMYLMISMLGTAVDALFLFEPLLSEQEGTSGPFWNDQGKPTFFMPWTPVMRRSVLLAAAACGLVEHGSASTVAVAVLLFFLDVLAGVYWVAVSRGFLDSEDLPDEMGPFARRFWSPLLLVMRLQAKGKTEGGAQATTAQPQLPVSLASPRIGARSAFGNEQAAQRVGRQVLCQDLIEAMTMHVNTALPKITPLHPLLEILQTLQLRLAALAQQLAAGTLQHSEVDTINSAIQAYTPGASASTAPLVTLLQQLNPEKWHDANGEHPTAPDTSTHPVHAALLQDGLKLDVWAEVPSLFANGKTSQGSAFELAFAVRLCDYFISHSWSDAGAKKVRMLREFLCLQALVGRAMVVFPLIAAFFVPLGFALERSGGAFKWWMLPALPLSMLAVLLLWVGASVTGLVPPKATPWACSATTIWIDKLCIDQSTPERKAAGVASVAGVLERSTRMVALMSASYFKRLWCVYELAVFTRAKPDGLLLLSLDWPSALHPFKRPQLSHEERELLSTFSCRQAECFLPRDRATVLQAIRDAFGSEERFDAYVRNELPAVLERSKAEYCSRLTHVAAESLALVFGA